MVSVLPAIGSGAFRNGEIQGRINLGTHVLRQASKFAAEHYRAEAAIDFSGEDVETFANPVWAPKRSTWVPVKRLAELGLCVTQDGKGEEMNVTLGVDQHIDDFYGPVLCFVLHNDGLTFRQGRVSHQPVAGDWFVFNDRERHGVKEAKGAAVFVALTLPLERL